MVLLKFVLYALPIYFLSFFKAPECVINAIERMFRRFLWGGEEGEKTIHWVAWSKICMDKNEGGLGLKNLKAFNFSLLDKWLWRLGTEGEGLWAKVLKENMVWRVIWCGQVGERIRDGGGKFKSWNKRAPVLKQIGFLKLLEKRWIMA